MRHPRELGAPPFGESRTYVADDRCDREAERGLWGGEAVRRQPFLDVHLEHGRLTQVAKVARPDWDERWLGAVPYKPIGCRECGQPAALEAPPARQLPQIVAVAVIRESEYVDELAQVPHRYLAPGVCGQQKGMMKSVWG